MIGFLVPGPKTGPPNLPKQPFGEMTYILQDDRIKAWKLNLHVPARKREDVKSQESN